MLLSLLRSLCRYDYEDDTFLSRYERRVFSAAPLKLVFRREPVALIDVRADWKNESIVGKLKTAYVLVLIVRRSNPIRGVLRSFSVLFVHSIFTYNSKLCALRESFR